jgi:hypothetical protein
MRIPRILIRRTVAVAALLPALAACDVVLSTHPVGLEPVAVEAEEWEGTWVADDGAFTLRVPEGAAGRVELGWIEEEGDRFVLKTSRVHLRSAGEWMFGSLENDEDPQNVRYLWGRLEKDEGKILFWLPGVEKFRQLVEEGLLPGEIVEGGDVVLGQLGAEHLKLITSGEKGVLFEWEAPMILRRLED